MIPNEEVLSRFTGLQVTVRDKNIDGALKKLKQMIKKEELMLHIQEKSNFRKPSAIKREKRNRAKARMRSEMRRNQ